MKNIEMIKIDHFDDELWEKCVEFHGHECPGLTMGYKAALYAIELLGIEFSKDEEIVCVSENDACGVDAIQVILSCTAGKGNLLFHLRGKTAYSFYERKSGKSVRLVLKSFEHNNEMTREERFKFYHALPFKDMFEVKDTFIELPQKAKIFDSYICDCCKEKTGAHWIRIENGKKLCLDCYSPYNRFDV